ncbi:MAG: hypothetical protein KZQ70_08190, partial [gamma proteobacterium symbiont of Lucinoma myriamae]|nr:hypothetical protein [gamma proteobacterium symbiont of Lucinoma myriamae]
VSVKQKSDYLAAKVVANNQEMYTHAKVEKAIATIKNYEVLSDFYFYSDKIIQDDEMFLGRIGEMLKSDFHPHQVIEISNQRIGVFTLDTQETIEDINSLYEYMNIDILFLYAPLRYEIKGLHACQFSWKNNIGLVKAEGSIFPFDLRTKKEKPVLQTTACKRLQDYTDYLQDDLEKRREWLKHLNKMLDKDEQFKLLEEKDAIIKERGNLYDVLKQKDEELKRRQRLITEKDAIIYEMTNRWKYLDGIVTLLQKLWRKIT